MKLLERPVKTKYINPIKDWYDKNHIPTASTNQASKYEKGMLISISNNEQTYENIFKSFPEIYISILKALKGKDYKISRWDIKVLKGDWNGTRIKLPSSEALLRVVANQTPIVVAGVHNYKKDDIRTRGKEYSHSHFYVYNAHHHLPSSPIELREMEAKIEAYLQRYVGLRRNKKVQGIVRLTPVGTGVYKFTDVVSPTKLYDYLNSPNTNPEANNVINYISNNRHMPEVQYPLTTIYSTKKL